MEALHPVVPHHTLTETETHTLQKLCGLHVSRWRRPGDQYHRDGCRCWRRLGETGHLREDRHRGRSRREGQQVRAAFLLDITHITERLVNTWKLGVCRTHNALISYCTKLHSAINQLFCFCYPTTAFSTSLSHTHTCSHTLSLSDLAAGVRIRSSGRGAVWDMKSHTELYCV